MTYSEQWDLETIFKGGLASPALENRLQALGQQIPVVLKMTSDWQFVFDEPAFEQMQAITMQLQQIESGLKQMGSFVNMIQSVDERNQQVAPMMDRINQLQNTARQIDVLLTKKLVALTVEQFETLVSQPAFAPIQFNLREKRQQGADLLDEQTEKLLDQLALDGLQGWSDHYDTIVAETQSTLR